jgi:hypothetical protein
LPPANEGDLSATQAKQPTASGMRRDDDGSYERMDSRSTQLGLLARAPESAECGLGLRARPTGVAPAYTGSCAASHVCGEALIVALIVAPEGLPGLRRWAAKLSPSQRRSSGRGPTACPGLRVIFRCIFLLAVPRNSKSPVLDLVQYSCTQPNAQVQHVMSDGATGKKPWMDCFISDTRLPFNDTSIMIHTKSLQYCDISTRSK